MQAPMPKIKLISKYGGTAYEIGFREKDHALRTLNEIRQVLNGTLNLDKITVADPDLLGRQQIIYIPLEVLASCIIEYKGEDNLVPRDNVVPHPTAVLQSRVADTPLYTSE